MPAKGAYAMKTTWLYDENAEVNPESDITEGSSKDENDIKITEGEEVFTFDADNFRGNRGDRKRSIYK